VDNGDYLCYSSIDCTDVRIREPQPFDPKWYSHKFHGPGLRYELAVSIAGDIVWINGPYPAGSSPDLSIYTETLRHKLVRNEVVVGDATYRDVTCVYDDGMNLETLRKIRARQESVFGRMKIFNVLCHRYRHPLPKHNIIFFAIGNLTQIAISNGEKLFSVE